MRAISHATMMPDHPTHHPLILTLQMEEAAFARFDALRRRHFPQHRNHIPAHATLFHHLPGEDEDGVVETVGAVVRPHEAPDVTVTGLRFTGRGVAYVLESDALAVIRGRLAECFATVLTAQDRQAWRPHVTVQNKVRPETARALHADLENGFLPFRFAAPGLLLWRYLGGPWAHRASFAFGDKR